jgi:hypothetical protein
MEKHFNVSVNMLLLAPAITMCANPILADAKVHRGCSLLMNGVSDKEPLPHLLIKLVCGDSVENNQHRSVRTLVIKLQ